MEQSRNFYIRNKPIVILDKRFKVINDFNLGDKGQLLISAVKVGGRLHMDNDGVERIRHILQLTKVEKINPNESRVF